MAPTADCVLCGHSAKSNSKTVTEISAISGRSLGDIVTTHFWQDAALMGDMGRKRSSFCRECHSLIVQIDAFEQSLKNSKESLEARRKEMTKSKARRRYKN